MGSKLKPSDRAPKRVRTDAYLPPLDKNNTDYVTKFFIIHSEVETKPMSKLSPFLVAKVLKDLVGEKFNAKKTFSGDLLVEVFEKNQAAALLCLNHILDTKVSVSAHRTLNTIRGVISEDDLMESQEEEILEGMRSQGVVAVKRITIRRDDKELPTRHLVLTFELNSLPSSVKAGYLNCRVRPYIPNPVRCFRCQRFGHGSRSCRGRETCARCGSSEHNADDCHEDMKCVNCKGKHPAYSRSCEHFKREKEILTLKVKENISYPEAKRRLLGFQRGSFAEVVRRGPAPPMASVGTQVSYGDLAQPLKSSGPKLKVQLPGRAISAARAGALPSRAKGSDLLSEQTETTPSQKKGTSGAVHTALPRDDRVDAGPSGSTRAQGSAFPAQGSAPPASPFQPPRGRGLGPSAPGGSRKPGEPSRLQASKEEPLLAPAEPMDESGSRSDEDRPHSSSESLLPASGGTTGRPNDTSKKKNAPRVKIDFKS